MMQPDAIIILLAAAVVALTAILTVIDNRE